MRLQIILLFNLKDRAACMHRIYKLERALCGDANPRRLVRQNAAGAPAAMQDTFLL